MKKRVNIPESSTTKPHTFANVNEIITVTNNEIADDMDDTLYMHLPEKKDIGRCYRWKKDFTLKTKKEAKKIIKEKKIEISQEDAQADFFVYNEKTNQLLPFKKNDYLMYEHEYLTFDGINYISRDNEGNEIGRF